MIFNAVNAFDDLNLMLPSKELIYNWNQATHMDYQKLKIIMTSLRAFPLTLKAAFSVTDKAPVLPEVICELEFHRVFIGCCL